MDLRRALVLPTAVALATVAAAGLAVGCSSDLEAPTPTSVVEVDGTMPSLEETALDGARFSTSDVRGRPVVVNFWATWCGPCEREQPMLVSAHDAMGDDIAFLGVDYRDQDDAARDWLERFDVPYPNVADPTGSIASEFGVTTGLPTTIVVDAEGRLRFRVLGEIDRETLDDLIERVGGA